MVLKLSVQLCTPHYLFAVSQHVFIIRIVLSLTFFSDIFTRLVVPEVPNESVAHWPVEMLPLVRSWDQRKASQLQVRRRFVMLNVSIWLENAHFTSHFNPFFREKMAQAYDFALDKIGMEIMSYQVHK